ncbi:MAG: metallophosphoesterase family protein [Bacteroidota bacterium]
MIKVGIISDTHALLPSRVVEFLSTCNEIWHAGDIGSMEVIKKLPSVSKVRAVWGNIDDAQMRLEYPLYQLFEIESAKVLMIHIGGYPKKYDKKALELIKEHKPTLFISGHSHILKVMYDQQYQLLHINPGAAGKYGFHQVTTAIRMDIEGAEFKNLEILELEK